jgi:hypothetical protein
MGNEAETLLNEPAARYEPASFIQSKWATTYALTIVFLTTESSLKSIACCHPAAMDGL